MSIAAEMNDVPHPGEFIKDELAARGWAQRDLAFILNVKEPAINPIMSGKRGISIGMAKALSEAFGISAEYFMNLQKAYELSTSADANPDIARRADLTGTFPIREMLRRGWINDTKDMMDFEDQLMRFFDISSLDHIPFMSHHAKKGSDYDHTTMNQWSWLFRVKNIAQNLKIPDYNKDKFITAIDELQEMLSDPEKIQNVPEILASTGVRFVIVETLPKTKIDGVCFWLDQKSPVIGMTCRYDRIDNFWFVLRHEMEHLLNEDGKNAALSNQMIDLDLDLRVTELPDEEIRANKAASEFCIDHAALDTFITMKYPAIKENDTLAFAQQMKRHPGIVIGQIQYYIYKHYGVNKYSWLTKHKIKIRQYLASTALMDGWGSPI